MSDNFPLTPGSGRNAATDEVTYSGDAADVQLVRPVLTTGSEGSKTVVELTGDAANGLDVDVTRLPALPAGGNNIGDVDVLTGPTGASALQSQGAAAHGASTVGNPVLQGCEAIAHGSNPTAVTAGQATKHYANRAGIPFVLGGHPNIVTLEAAYTSAQTDTAIIASIATGTKIVVTQIQVLCANANTAFPQCRVGFGATNTPTTTGVVLTHPGIPAGGGVSRGDGSGIIGIGGDGEELRITCDAPTGGSLRVLVSYFTIES